MHEAQRKCIGCPFGGPKVGSKGAIEAPLVFVAESPGIEEVKYGEPLVGPSGKLFHEHVAEDLDCLILNAIECRPIGALKTEPNMQQAIACCRDNLLDKVQMHPRRLIVAMGNAAVHSLTGNTRLKITQIRGKLLNSPLAELGILPIIHPAALMRGTGSYRQWRNDVEYAIDLGLGGDPYEYTPADVVFVDPEITQHGIDKIFDELLWGTNKLTCDIETSGFDFINDRILSVGITSQTSLTTGYCFLPEHLPYLKPHFENPHIKWCWHNGKFDIKFLRTAGIQARVDDDTMLLSYAQDETGGVHDLETVASDVLHAPSYKHMLDRYLPNKKTSYEVIPLDVLGEYQAIDTANTAQIREVYTRRVNRCADLSKLYRDVLIPASEMLARVETNGIAIDTQRLDENETYFSNMKADINEQLNELIGYSINPNSPKQVSELIFKRMRMPNRKKGSTDVSVLTNLYEKTEHPVFKLLLDYRKASKMYGTYVKGLRRHINPTTGRIHPTYLIHGTRTGRLAARDPNVQNPPRLAQIRGTFIPAPGYEMLEVDLSQAELRSLAVLSGDPDLVAVYNEGLDLHTDLAVYLFPGWEERAKSDDPVQRAKAKEQRVKCKNVNFGIIYGITPFGLKDQMKSTVAEAREMLTGWANKYKVAWKFIQKCRATPRNNQVITTCFGRKKRVGVVSAGNINFLMNEAANFPHQSIASDITLMAAIRCQPTLESWGVRIVNLVHDAIIMEVPITPKNETRGRAIELVSHEMAQVPKDYGLTAIPFESDAEVGSRWGSLKTVT